MGILVCALHNFYQPNSEVLPRFLSIFSSSPPFFILFLNIQFSFVFFSSLYFLGPRDWPTQKEEEWEEKTLRFVGKKNKISEL